MIIGLLTHTKKNYNVTKISLPFMYSTTRTTTHYSFSVPATTNFSFIEVLFFSFQLKSVKKFKINVD